MPLGAPFAYSMGVSSGRALCFAVMWVAAMSVARPAGADPAPAARITLARAIEEGARRGPAVVESARAREAAVDFARDPGSSLPSAPQVTVMAGARKPYNLPVGPEVVVSAQQEIAGRGLGSARRRAAEWASRAATSDLERARVEGALTSALAWIDLLEAQQLMSARVTALADAEKVARLAEVRVTSGVATATERSLAAAEVGAAKLALLDAEGRATEARFTLALAAGEPLDRPLVAEGSIQPGDRPAVDPQRVLEGASRHPAILAADARAAHAAADVAVARAINGPFFALGASVWREGSGDHAAAATVTVPLPFFDSARYEAARQATLAAGASAYAGRLRGELEREARVALHEREHTREVKAQLEGGVVAPLRRALETAVLAYGAGTADLSVVLLARRSALTAEERLVSAMADVQRADLRVAALGGTLLPRGPR